MLSYKTIGELGIFLLSFIVFGYPIQCFIPFLLNIDPNSINIGCRIVLLVLSIYLIFLTYLKNNKNNKINPGWRFFIMYWFIYGARLIYDLEYKGLTYLETSSFYVYSFAFGVSLFPSIAVYRTLPYIDLKRSLSALFWTICLSNICILYGSLSYMKWNIVELLQSRAVVALELEGVRTVIVNSITIGFLGQTLAIIAIHLLNFPLYKNKYFNSFLYFCLILGLVNLVAGASRGPLLFFGVLLLFEFYLIAKKTKYFGYLLVKTSAWLFVIGISFSSIIVNKIQNEDLALFSRVSTSYEARQDQKLEDRDFEFASALVQFSQSPVYGDAFVTDYDKSYSHNLILDVLMATGLIGAIVFGGFLYYTFVKLRWIVLSIKTRPLIAIFFILYLGSFLLCLLSGGLFAASNFWLLSAAVLALK